MNNNNLDTYILKDIKNNKRVLNKVDNITREIQEEVKYKMFNDGLVLL